jgi:hypothetical protein
MSSPLPQFPFGFHTTSIRHDHSVEFCNVLLGERFDRLSFVGQPSRQRD